MKDETFGELGWSSSIEIWQKFLTLSFFKGFGKALAEAEGDIDGRLKSPPPGVERTVRRLWAQDQLEERLFKVSPSERFILERIQATIVPLHPSGTYDFEYTEEIREERLKWA